MAHLPHREIRDPKTFLNNEECKLLDVLTPSCQCAVDELWHGLETATPEEAPVLADVLRRAAEYLDRLAAAQPAASTAPQQPCGTPS